MNIKVAKSRQRKLALELYRCVTGRQSDFWTGKLKESQDKSDVLEKKRVEINRLRQALDSVRKETEARRVEIERRHRQKVPGSDYEIEFRAYMKSLNDDYFHKIENDLFTGYADLKSGIEALNEFLNFSILQCTAPKSP